MPAAVDEPRVSDFLDDKLQTLADLQSLDELLASVRQQHDVLQQQVAFSLRFSLPTLRNKGSSH
jgi:RAD50-interacting protein 1